MSVSNDWASAFRLSLVRLNPRYQLRNPIMFIVFIGAVLTSLVWVGRFFDSSAAVTESTAFVGQVAFWLWFTVIFANMAEALAEGQGKAQADSLKKARREVSARKLPDGNANAEPVIVPANSLRRGDTVVVEAGDFIPADGRVVAGIASVDESAVTGESAPVIRESGGDRDAVTGGTRVLSDRLLIEITSDPGESFLDRMIGLVENAKRQRTPNEIALSILLTALTVIFLLACITLIPFSSFAVQQAGMGVPISLTVVTALLVCLIPTTIGGLMSAIGISGMQRLIKANVIAVSGRAVEAAGDVNVLLLDKTGTITFGNRQASDLFAAPGVTPVYLAEAAELASLADETPEGRSIVVYARSRFNLPERGNDLPDGAVVIPFSAEKRLSGITVNGRTVIKGAADAVIKHIAAYGSKVADEVSAYVADISRHGGTPLVVAEGGLVLGVIGLKDVVKPEIKKRLADLRKMGIKSVMITGDNPLTAAAIAGEAGVDDFIAEATPEAKLRYIRKMQEGGELVAMVGDGTNDAPALAQSDVAVAMNSGTQAAKEAGNMVDLDSDPTKLIEIVAIGKQLLMTRGSLTTFSIANDVAKYFAIIPAAFTGIYPQLGVLNVMQLHSAESAVLSAVVFNALIIIALVPLALKGVAYRPVGAEAALRRNLTVYGLGGIITPFAGIKLLDCLLRYTVG